MSRLFGDVIQNGYVVRDIDAAMRHWIDVLGEAGTNTRILGMPVE